MSDQQLLRARGPGRARGRSKIHLTTASVVTVEEGLVSSVALAPVGIGGGGGFTGSYGGTDLTPPNSPIANSSSATGIRGMESAMSEMSLSDIKSGDDEETEASLSAFEADSHARRTPVSVSSSYAGSATGVSTINPGFQKGGEDGQPVPLITNYYRMNKSSKFELFQYRVDFVPIEQDTRIKKALMRQHEDVLGKYVFDGSVMYRSSRLEASLLNLESTGEEGKAVYRINIRLVSQVNPEDSMYLQFYNIVMRKAMTLLGMEELGRNFYDPTAGISFPKERITLWPGFVTAIRSHDLGVLLCVEVTHKVLRTSSVFDVMMSLKRDGMGTWEYEKAVRAAIEDTIVLTHYNKRTYTISDINFRATPASTFLKQDGSVESYASYFSRRYGLTIPEHMMEQPLLVSKPKKKDINKGTTGDIYLVPSLCNPTGLSDDMRQNYQLMSKLSEHLHMMPAKRKQKLDEFMVKLKTDPKVQEEFRAWNVEFDATPVDMLGRVMEPQTVIVNPGIGRGPEIKPNAKGDWTRDLKGRGVLKAVDLNQWMIFAPQRVDMNGVSLLVTTLKKMGAELGIRVSEPVEGILPYDPSDSSLRTVYAAIKPHLETLKLVFFVLPNNTLRLYSEIKNFTTLKLGIPSQCFLAKNLKHKSLESVASKVMLQVTAKMGGVPWGIRVPLKGLMVLGFDVYHCSTREGQSAGALVATTSPTLTSYYSIVSFHQDKSELAKNLWQDVQIALDEYRKRNGTYPLRIVMFRDGVGEGQIDFVRSNEIEQIRLALRDMYFGMDQELPKLSFIIVTKKINTRAFLRGLVNANLPVGTVLDNSVTLPNRYDFFLVSQDVRQGTVSPTNYNVIWDESGLKADQMQKLAFKLTHLYFNWSGTVAVPAPCQYAHKLAYITGVAVGEKAKDRLNEKLWYL